MSERCLVSVPYSFAFSLVFLGSYRKYMGSGGRCSILSSTVIGYLNGISEKLANLSMAEDYDQVNNFK